MASTDYRALSDQEIARRVGARLRALRLRRNRTQEDLAKSTAISIGTVKALEAGRGKLGSLITLLRELDALDGLDSFLPEPPPSPLELARRQGRMRRRASGKASTQPTDKDSPW
ncbi:MAG: helix-turn-helix domain-containing protein [Acidiferrobacter sp.]